MHAARIRKSWLQQRLVRITQTRAIITMLGQLFGMILLGTILPRWVWEGKEIASSVIVLAAFFGPGLLISWLMTILYCRSAVTCPYCGASLWRCGSGNFKARKVKVVAERCAGCRAWIV